MKKIFIVLIISIFATSANACEICGCGVGNYYIGLLPNFNHRFIGVRYHFNSFRTRLNDDPSQFSKDFYQTVELWGGFNIGKRVQVLVLLPYNFNHQESDEGITDINGLGDALALANYKVFDKTSGNGDRKRSQQLWIGGGIKFPTGTFEIEDGDPDVASVANTQRGSGSVDFIINSMYNVRMNKWGINTSASYKINNSNKDEYKFGNKASASSFVYYAATASPTTVISPNMGLMYEYTKKSSLQKGIIDLTGGSLLQAAAGMEVSLKKIAIGANVQLPVTQNFADGQTKAKVKGMFHVTFAL